MADRGRDLKVSILSDADRFDVDQPARDLERLGDAAQDTGRALDNLTEEQDRAARAARDLGDDTDKGARALDDLGTDAKDTARKVDSAFDAIARSSKKNLRDKLDDDADKAKGSLSDIRDEANDTAREMGASFGGGLEDIQDGFQELAANAGASFGPIGLAAGAAAAVGVGLIRAEAEKIKELAGEMAEDMIEAGGKISDAFIDSKLQEMAADGTLIQLQEQAATLDISFVDLARAMAGDGEAATRVKERITELSSAITENAAKNGTATGEMYAQQTALGQLANKVNGTATAHELATRATSAYAKAATTAGANTRNAAHVTGAAWDDLRSNLGRPITAKVAVQAPSSAEIDAVNRAIRNGIGTIVVPIKAGQSRFENTSSNSRYRQ